MFILQHADSSAMGLVLQAGQFWQIINKDCLSNYRRFLLFFRSGEDVFFAFSTFLSVLVRSR